MYDNNSIGDVIMKEFFETILARVNSEQVAWLDEYAARTNQTRSKVMRQALAQMQMRDKLVQRRDAPLRAAETETV
jgi:predicted transcriptional regulator